MNIRKIIKTPNQSLQRSAQKRAPADLIVVYRNHHHEGGQFYEQ
jgi:hypothetical protein